MSVNEGVYFFLSEKDKYTCHDACVPSRILRAEFTAFYVLICSNLAPESTLSSYFLQRTLLFKKIFKSL